MKQMKVSTRLASLVGSMAVLVYRIGELGLSGITDSNERLQSVYEDRAVPAAELGELRAFTTGNAKLLKQGLEPGLAAVRAADPAKVQQLLVEKIRPQFQPAQRALRQSVMRPGGNSRQPRHATV